MWEDVGATQRCKIHRSERFVNSGVRDLAEEVHVNLTPSSDGSATVVALGDEAASRSELAGAKAAALARSALRGLPTLDGFVITTRAGLTEGAAHRDDDPALARAWTELSAGGRRPLVVRSSHRRGRRGLLDGRHVRLGARRARRHAFHEAVDAVLGSAAARACPTRPWRSSSSLLAPR